MLVQQDTGLIVIDVQGKLARLVDNSDAMIDSIATMIRAMQTLGIPVLFVEQLPDKLGATVEELNQFIPAGEAFAKATFSALRTESIDQQVKAIFDVVSALSENLDIDRSEYQHNKTTYMSYLREIKEMALFSNGGNGSYNAYRGQWRHYM